MKLPSGRKIKINNVSKVIEIFLEVLKSHLIFINLHIFKTILNLIEADILINSTKNTDNVLRSQISFLFSVQVIKQK